MSDELITRALVGGQWINGRGGTFPVTDPATGDEIARVADCTTAEVTSAIGKRKGDDVAAGHTITHTASDCTHTL
ncbi:hypothetical protein E2C01_087323 [Portunus trituberculatus]|uniref:Succinate-semialdehyde dehydrogenase, mitochondrial n=1 Tax=Portunus trituberculatus TaxID=210409 RepID=A0A5B7JD09_PORTR|nr:hypothetical protein [Portunus trituberculatus]